MERVAQEIGGEEREQMGGSCGKGFWHRWKTQQKNLLRVKTAVLRAEPEGPQPKNEACF